jgi:hypothetical protein
MSQLTDQYLAETGKIAIVQKYRRVYYTAYYVNWLEKLVEGVRERAPNNASTKPCAHWVPGAWCKFRDDWMCSQDNSCLIERPASHVA